jgi:hypothetical protein
MVLAGRTTSQGFVREFLAFIRSMILADAAGDDSSTRFSWPRGL